MNVKIMVFGAPWDKDTKRIDDELAALFNGMLPIGKEIAHYDTLSESLSEFSAGFRGTDVILLFAAPAVFAQTKQMLAGALRLNLQQAPEITRLTRHTLGEPETGSEEMLAHCMVPVGCRSFCLGDGLFAGFAATAKRQNMILLPYSAKRTVRLLSEQVIPYLNQFYSASLATDFHIRFCARNFSKILTQHNATLAVSGTKTSVFIRKIAQYDASLQQLIRFTPTAEARGNLPPEEYAGNLSIAASELEGCPLGAAITNAYFSGTDASAEKTVYLAFTDESDSYTMQIRSDAGEQIESFLQRSACDLIDFIADSVASAPIGKSNKKKKNKKSQKSVDFDEKYPEPGKTRKSDIQSDDGAKKIILSRGAVAALTGAAAVILAVGLLAAYFVTDKIIENRDRADAASEAAATYAYNDMYAENDTSASSYSQAYSVASSTADSYAAPATYSSAYSETQESTSASYGNVPTPSVYTAPTYVIDIPEITLN